MPFCGLFGTVRDFNEKPRPGVNRGKGRGVTKPPVKKRRK